MASSMAPSQHLTSRELQGIYLAVAPSWIYVRAARGMNKEDEDWLEKWITQCVDNREYSS